MAFDTRIGIAALALSATGLVYIAQREDYRADAYPDPVHGTKVPTAGFGSTGGAQAGSLSVHRTLFKGDGGLNHLSIPGQMAASGDDRYLYVTASGGDGAIITYRRLSLDQLFRDGFETPPAN